MTTDFSAERAAHDLFVLFSRLRRQFFAAVDTQGLSPSQVAVLSRLGKSGPMSPSELAAAERVRPQAITPILAVLSDKGFIERSNDDVDGRRRVASVSAAGQAVLEGGRRAGSEWLIQALEEHCTLKERRMIIDAIAVVDRAINIDEAKRN